MLEKSNHHAGGTMTFLYLAKEQFEDIMRTFDGQTIAPILKETIVVITSLLYAEVVSLGTVEAYRKPRHVSKHQLSGKHPGYIQLHHKSHSI